MVILFFKSLSKIFVSSKKSIAIFTLFFIMVHLIQSCDEPKKSINDYNLLDGFPNKSEGEIDYTFLSGFFTTSEHHDSINTSSNFVYFGDKIYTGELNKSNLGGTYVSKISDSIQYKIKGDSLLQTFKVIITGYTTQTYQTLDYNAMARRTLRTGFDSGSPIMKTETNRIPFKKDSIINSFYGQTNENRNLIRLVDFEKEKVIYLKKSFEGDIYENDSNDQFNFEKPFIYQDFNSYINILADVEIPFSNTSDFFRILNFDPIKTFDTISKTYDIPYKFLTKDFYSKRELFKKTIKIDRSLRFYDELEMIKWINENEFSYYFETQHLLVNYSELRKGSFGSLINYFDKISDYTELKHPLNKYKLDKTSYFETLDNLEYQKNILVNYIQKSIFSDLIKKSSDKKIDISEFIGEINIGVVFINDEIFLLYNSQENTNYGKYLSKLIQNINFKELNVSIGRRGGVTNQILYPLNIKIEYPFKYVENIKHSQINNPDSLFFGDLSMIERQLKNKITDNEIITGLNDSLVSYHLMIEKRLSDKKLRDLNAKKGIIKFDELSEEEKKAKEEADRAAWEEYIEVPWSIVQVAPLFTGCDNKKCSSKKIESFVKENFNTNILREQGVKGNYRIYIQFKFDKSGGVVDIKTRESKPKIKEQIIKVINFMTLVLKFNFNISKTTPLSNTPTPLKPL